MKRTFKYRIYPTSKQELILKKNLDLCRNLYNACLEQRRIAYRNHGIILTRFDQQKELPKIKETIPEYKSIYSQVLSVVVKNADQSFQNFFRRVKNGEKPGYPRFKGQYRFNSITYPQFGFKVESNILRLSKIGNIKIIYHRPTEGVCKTLTIKRDSCDDWWAMFVCELSDTKKVDFKITVGVDVGIEKLVTLSDGTFINNQKNLKKSGKCLKRLQRGLSRKKKGSMNRQKARLKLARKHRKIERQRDDYLHKVSRYLVDKHDIIGYEDLNIKGMIKSHYIANSISDASWGKLIGYISYKAEWAGKIAVPVDPKNTSQTCSRCGNVAKISLSQRSFHCKNCSLKIDRDLNAAINIESRALEKLGQGLPEVTPEEIESLHANLVNEPGKINQRY